MRISKELGKELKPFLAKRPPNFKLERILENDLRRKKTEKTRLKNEVEDAWTDPMKKQTLH